MFEQPSIMVTSGYVDPTRQLAGGGLSWADMVRQKFAQRPIRSIQDVLAYSTETMEVPQYADAWSFTSALTSAPDIFAALVLEMRNGEEAWPAIQKLYDVDAETALVKWHTFAQDQR